MRNKKTKIEITNFKREDYPDGITEDLENLEDYHNNYYVWLEVIHRYSGYDTFTEKEWAIIGKMFGHENYFWDALLSKYGRELLPIFKKVSKLGFDEWEKKYKKMLKEVKK